MRYKVYTDGAVDEENRIISCSFIILAGKRFIHRDFRVYKGKTSLLSEVTAIGFAIEYILKNVAVTSEDTVEFYTDSKKAMELLLSFDVSEERTKTHSLAKMAFTGLLLLKKKCTCKFIKVSAHADDLYEVNGNKVADRLNKVALFIARNEAGIICTR